jgi:predicted glycosyltransferase
MRIWIDIDNPPQVQYLLPFRAAFNSAAADTVITARDYGTTIEMLERAGVQPHVFGARVGRGKLRKGTAVIRRARDHVRLFARIGRPDVLLAASRAAAVAAWRMRIPSFLICDYEHVHLALYRATGSTILHPEVIDESAFVRRGLRPDRLLPFRGLKEDLTFAGVDVDAIEPHDLGDVPEPAVKILFRPPSETSHYYQESSTSMAREALVWLARAGALVVFSPREPDQVALLDGLRWSHPPVILRRSVPFVSLLKSVDAVVCAGGTMLREAAYLGIPAYGIFQSEIGGVDRWLERIGRAKLLNGAWERRPIDVSRRGPLERLDSNPHLLDEIVALVSAGAGEVQQAPRRHQVRSAAPA